MTEVIAGQIQMLFPTILQSHAHIRSGKLKILAITGEKRIPALPNVPAMNEILPGFLAKPWTGIVAPPKTSSAIILKLSAAVAEGLKLPDVAKRLAERQLEPVGGNPEEMLAFIRQDTDSSMRFTPSDLGSQGKAQTQN